MTQIITPPDVSDADLIFNEQETKEILSFFWPHLTADIEAMTVTNQARRMAQSLLIAGIDASHAMGYIQALFETVAKPKGGLLKMGKKLGQRFLKHWWKHTRPQDLEKVKIYETVRRTISYKFKTEMELLLAESQASIRLAPFFVMDTNASGVWV